MRSTLAAIGLSAGTAVTLSLAGGATASAAPAPTPTTAAATPALAVGLAALVTPVPARHRRVRTTVVRPGDGFWTIAERTHVNWEDLARTNDMTLASMLYTGEVLRLPNETTSSPTAGSTGAGTTAASSAPAAPATPPAAPAAPAASGSSVTPGSSFESCVIERESDGNPEITSASGYWGLYQFSYATWVAYGGAPGAFGSADAAAQQAVFDHAVAEGGASNWAPYDGC